MRVRVAEAGDRPMLATAARLNAPQGAQVLADVMHDLDFCDDVLLTLDWEKNALAVSAVKIYPDIRRRADIDFVVDMEDAFHQDNFSREIAMGIIDHLIDEFHKKDEEAKQMVGRT
jgi:hypothetical protein